MWLRSILRHSSETKAPPQKTLYSGVYSSWIHIHHRLRCRWPAAWQAGAHHSGTHCWARLMQCAAPVPVPDEGAALGAVSPMTPFRGLQGKVKWEGQTRELSLPRPELRKALATEEHEVSLLKRWGWFSWYYEIVCVQKNNKRNAAVCICLEKPC
jgi:hypothetical protein